MNPGPLHPITANPAQKNFVLPPLIKRMPSSQRTGLISGVPIIKDGKQQAQADF